MPICAIPPIFAAGVLAWALTAPTRAHAATATFHVPEGCGWSEELREGVARLAGSETTLSWPEALLITPADGGEQFELRLTLEGETRVLRDTACETQRENVLERVSELQENTSK